MARCASASARSRRRASRRLCEIRCSACGRRDSVLRPQRSVARSARGLTSPCAHCLARLDSHARLAFVDPLRTASAQGRANGQPSPHRRQATSPAPPRGAHPRPSHAAPLVPHPMHRVRPLHRGAARRSSTAGLPWRFPQPRRPASQRRPRPARCPSADHQPEGAP